MDHTVIGLFNTVDEAQHVVKHLVDSGIKRDHISLIANDASNQYSKYIGQKSDVTSATTEDAVKAGDGANFGAVVGGLTGILVGLGALAIPGIGPVLAAGPLLAALGGGAVGAVAGAATGGVVAALVKTGLPEEDAQYYAEGVRRGGTLVTVDTTDNQVQQVLDILNEHGAIDVHQKAEEWKRGGWKGFDANAKPYVAESTTTTRATTPVKETPNRTTDKNQQETVLPVIKEELQVGKREVERGGVRVYQRVTETPVEEKVQLREERVNVERRPVDRPVTAADQAFKENTIEMKERAEEAVVSKTARVVEEVVIGKEVTQRTETVRDTVRNTDVQVENTANAKQTVGFDTYATDFRNHYTTNYGKTGYTYDQYTPAYRYGYTIANDQNYAGDWTAIEPRVRQSWEQNNKGTWEEFKDAVRYAWDKVRGVRPAQNR